MYGYNVNANCANVHSVKNTVKNPVFWLEEMQLKTYSVIIRKKAQDQTDTYILEQI